MLYTREYRDNFRKVILNMLLETHGDVEIYAFHPLIEDLLVSNKGNIKNAYTDRPRKFQVNSNGYLGLNVNLVHKGRRFVFAHRLICEAFLGYTGVDNYYYEVNHRDGNKKNNDLTNLEWLTREENLEHSRINKLSKIKYGEDANNTKLTKQDICDIVDLRKLGFMVKDIAESFSINKSYCGQISRNISRRNG